MPRYAPVAAELSVQGYVFGYVWSRKAVKNYNLRVQADGTVSLSTPTYVTREQAERFLCEHVDFIRKAREKMAAHHPAKLYRLETGEQLPIFGVLHTVCVTKEKKRRIFLESGTLHLALPNPQNEGARAALFWQFAKSMVLHHMRTLTAEYAPFLLPARVPVPQVSLRRMKSRIFPFPIGLR